jgi:hypothetical protein
LSAEQRRKNLAESRRRKARAPGPFVRPVETRHGDTIVADFSPYWTVSAFFA